MIGSYLKAKLVDDEQRWGRPFRAFIIGLLIGNIIYLIGIYFVGMRTHRINYFSNIYLLIPLLGGLIGIMRLWGAHTAQHPIRDTYRGTVAWFCVGLVLWAIGCTIGMVYSLRFDVPVPFVWWGDLFFAACFICWTIGIIQLHNVSGLNFLEGIRNVATPLIALLIAALNLAVKASGNTPSAQSSTHDVLTFVANLFFPVVDLFNLFLLITLLPRPVKKDLAIQVRKPFRVIVLGYFFLCIASYTFNLTNGLPDGTRFAYYNGGFTDAMFAVAFTILSFAISLISFKELSQANEPETK